MAGDVTAVKWYWWDTAGVGKWVPYAAAPAAILERGYSHKVKEIKVDNGTVFK